MLFKIFGEPWQAMDMLQRQMNQLFDDFLPVPERTTPFPLVNMWGSDNEVMIVAEIPGIDPAALEINVVEATITIQGNRKIVPAAEEKDVVYHRQERPKGEFKRMLKLPFRVDADKVEAKYEKGIIHIKLPRAEKDKPRQIKVQGS